MFSSIFDSNKRQLKTLYTIVDKINSLEAKYEGSSQEALKQQTAAWKNLLHTTPMADYAKVLESILPDAFAIVREASKRTLGLRHYDVQLLAGIALHHGKIAEQKTGEGKTLTATLPLYLNALTGLGAHLVTPNDYLSRHGAGWMGAVYAYLGISVGIIMEEKAFVYDASYENDAFKDDYAKHLKEVKRAEAYASDIVYGTNHEFGFDYLRDNMAPKITDIVQTNPRGEWGVHNFAIVDEVDSILIDVARTPLIISTADTQPTARYYDAARIVKTLAKDTDFEVDAKFKSVSLTDLGIRRVENLLGIHNLYEQDFEMVHLIEQTLAAYSLYEKDKDYVVKNNQVVIVDQFTGRLLPSNRYSHGLHQAIEAKEGVDVQQESKTLAEISYQNYFRMYKKLAGMTGTALTEAEEFYKIYKLEVISIPTNKSTGRIDHNDAVYKTEAGKFKAVADDIEEKHAKGQPVLVGTTSIEKSQLLHELLRRRGIPHEILNAKNHEQEALIIAQAGRKGMVTVSTNMAGRGVDILLGGDPVNLEEQAEVRELGGLHVIGTERHESRRIDNQLRGRSGRQGDPGSSKFFISLQDELMRLFGGVQIENIMNRFGLDDSVPLEASLVSRAIENAQKKVEGFNFDRRKQVVEMDDVINVHRDVVYKIRRRLLDMSAGSSVHEAWFVNKLVTLGKFDVSVWNNHRDALGLDRWLRIFSELGLPVIDMLWMEHLVDMDHLREGIGLRGYAQKDPMVEYKRESHERFEILLIRMYSAIAERVNNLNDSATSLIDKNTFYKQNLIYKKSEYESGVSDEQAVINAVKVLPVVNKEKVGRNDPCPCGSGKKYKNCHMNA